MESRIDYFAAALEVMNAMLSLEKAVVTSGLEKSLIELIKTRASQINGCAFCIDMHTRDAMKDGETVTRLLLLDAWGEAPFYSPREQAALAWTEALTLISETHAPDKDWTALKAQFSEEETRRYVGQPARPGSQNEPRTVRSACPCESRSDCFATARARNPGPSPYVYLGLFPAR